MKSSTRSFYEGIVHRAIERIAASLDEPLDLGQLAADAGLSPFHFHRVFRGMVGETPLDLSRRLRLERAAWRLSTEDAAVTEVALDAGYESHEAFTRAFRVTFGTPPSVFRARPNRRIEIAAPSGLHFRADGCLGAFVPRDTGGKDMNVDVLTMPDMRVGCVRHVGPYNQIGEAFARLGAIAGAAGLFVQPQPTMIALYHDAPDTTPPAELRSDAGVSVPTGVPMPSGLTEQRIAAGVYARTVHVGSYEQLGDTWARFLGEWLPASGRRLGSGPSYEIYRNDPSTTPKDQLQTEIYVPLASEA